MKSERVVIRLTRLELGSLLQFGPREAEGASETRQRLHDLWCEANRTRAQIVVEVAE